MSACHDGTDGPDALAYLMEHSPNSVYTVGVLAAIPSSQDLPKFATLAHRGPPRPVDGGVPPRSTLPGLAGYKKWGRKLWILGENVVGWQFTGGGLEEKASYRSNEGFGQHGLA